MSPRARAALCAAALVASLAARAAAASEPAVAPVDVVICESHHRALVYWLRAAEAGRLPRQGVEVVHFDAHPDLAIPRVALSRAWPGDPEALVRELSIASFQLAAFRAGLISRVVWLRPGFATQIADGEREFLLGVGPDGSLQVSDPSDYWLLDGEWSEPAAIRDATRVSLRVLPLEAAAREAPLASGAVILDIDLDGFATRNPAADRLRAARVPDEDLARAREIFSPDRLQLSADPVARQLEVRDLVAALGALAEGPSLAWPGALAELWRRGIGASALYDLVAILWRAEPGARGSLLADGRQLVGLPESAAGEAEVRRTAALLAELITVHGLRPALVTIARSVRDGFTPPDRWPAIEWTLIRALAGALPGARVGFDQGAKPAPLLEP